MDVLTITLIFMLVGLAVWLVATPLWQRAHTQLSLSDEPSGTTLAEYQARYQAALASIRDLTFDYEMGKVPVEDYEALLTKTKLEAAHLRQRIDQLSESVTTEMDAVLEAEIETRVAEMRGQQISGDDSLQLEVEAELERLKAVQSTEVHDLTCPTCGKAARSDDQFCSGCGQALPTASPPALSAITQCPQCEYAYQPGDAFCAECGTSLSETAAPTYEEATV